MTGAATYRSLPFDAPTLVPSWHARVTNADATAEVSILPYREALGVKPPGGAMMGVSDQREFEREASGAEAQAAALMGRYCDGDEVAFHALYALVASRILGYLMHMIRDRASAEDLLQQTFLKLHQSRAAYVRGAAPMPWLFTIAHRTCLDEIRRRKAARTVSSTPSPGAERAPIEPRADLTGVQEGAAEEALFEPELAQATLAALERLPRNQKEALVLTKLHGKSVAEAAAVAGTTPGAIKLRAHRAYVTLRELLKLEKGDR